MLTLGPGPAPPAELAAAQHHGEAEALEEARTPQVGAPVDDAAGDDDFADEHGHAVQAPTLPGPRRS